MENTALKFATSCAMVKILQESIAAVEGIPVSIEKLRKI